MQASPYSSDFPPAKCRQSLDSDRRSDPGSKLRPSVTEFDLKFAATNKDKEGKKWVIRSCSLFWSLASGASWAVGKCYYSSRSHRQECSVVKYSKVQSVLILAAFRITRAAIDDDPCQLCLHVVVLNRREEEEGAGLDREYWERVNQVREEPLNFLFQGKTVNSVTFRSDNVLKPF